MATTSESLLIRLKSGDPPEAWSRFVQLYTPLIFFWARKTGLSQHDAADLVQDVLMIVLCKLPQLNYDPEKSFRGWLRRITLNRHHEIARRRKINVIQGDARHIEDLVDPKLAESTWDLDYARRLVATAMEVLKPDFAPETWAALQQLLATGQSAAEISRSTGVSVWTIYKAKSRLMKRLRSELEGLLD